MEMLPACERGVNWGVKRLVLLRTKKHMLWLSPGHKVWAGNYCPWIYAPQEIVFSKIGGTYADHKDLAEGGTIVKMLQRPGVEQKIQELFGVFIPTAFLSKHWTMVKR